MKRKFFVYTSAVFVTLCLVLLLASFFSIQKQKQYIFDGIDGVQHSHVAIVFGAGLVGDQPSDALRDRLIVAARLHEAGLVDSILVSGDNSTSAYSEPDVMLTTLVNDFHVPREHIFVDYAGRRTYDTCIRSREIWGVEHAILVSQAYHLPRAIWTCKKLGVESVGVSASLQPYVYEDTYKKREFLAKWKAIFDVFILKPDHIGGDFIQDID